MGLFRKRDGNKPQKVDRRTAWRDAADRVGGTLVEGKRPGQDKIVLAAGPWSLVMDTYTVHTGQVTITYTRGRGFFHDASELKLLIRKRSFFDSVLENLGFGSGVSVNRMFDRRYVVRGKPRPRLRSVVSAALAEAMLGQASVRVSAKRAGRKHRAAMGPETKEITTHVTGVVKEPERIAGLFAVLRETLDALQRIGAAAPLPPGSPTPPG